MPLKKLITALFLIMACGCTTGKHPTWVGNGLHPGYPPDQFLVGVGISSRSRDRQADVQKADTHARLEVAKQLKVSIQSHLTSRQEQKARSFLPETYTSKTVQKVKEDVDLLLGGVTIAERWYNEKDHLHYSMAVLNKGETAKRLSSDIARHSHQVNALSLQSDLLLKKGDITGALQKKIKALDHYRNYLTKKQRVAVLKPRASGSADVPPGNPYDSLMELKNSMDLIILDGDMQAGRIGRALDRPLRIKALYNQNTPIDHLPVTAHIADQTGKPEQNRTTGKDGTAAIRSLDIQKTGKHMNQMTVSVDWNRLIKEALGGESETSWEGFLSGPSVHFKYRLRVPEVSHILIKICEQGRYSGVDAAALLHSTSVDLMKKKGFLIKKTGRGQNDRTLCSGALGIESMVRRDKPLSDIVLVEKINVDFSGRRGRGYVFRATMSVTAYDMAYHEIIASMNSEALGGAGNRKTAAERAIKAVADELIPQIASRIVEGL
ncbi:hypothetical protein [Desulfoluna sp.]|uniref:hypothetical protein n=1 Tax=Desulfoluna sp. TaxID=2045199 RepID=UPI0026158AA6|nr:hypothetical protein [Desulfoluna sp.]